MLLSTRLFRLYASKQLTCAGFAARFSTNAADLAADNKKYQELCQKFEKEWTITTRESDEKLVQSFEADLTPAQRKHVSLLVDAYLSLNIMETRLLNQVVKEQIMKKKGLTAMQVNLDLPSIKQLENGTFAPVNPNWAQQQEVISKLWPKGQVGISNVFAGISGTGSGSAVGAGGNASAAVAAAAPEEKPAEEAPKENYDLELGSIDAAQKIKIIKEVRTLFNLGLKEAKDMVEKTPCVLKSGVKKAEAEELKEKLIALGCTVNLL